MWYIPSLTLLILLVISSFLSFIPYEIRDFSQELVPSHVRNKISEVTINLDAFPRLSIWRNAIIFILEKPLFGWGANSFPYLYKIKTGLLNNHTHNLFLELSVSYGLIVSIFFFYVISYILIKSFNTIFIVRNKSSAIDKGWWAAGFIFFFSHLFDILIFDIRINLAIWIILAGLRNSFSNLNENYLQNKSLEN